MHLYLRKHLTGADYIMKRLFTILFFVSALQANAQKISNQDIKTLKQVEDSLQTYSRDMIFADEASARFNADSAFIKTLVRALKIPYSFSYSFDSIKTVSKIYSPDSTFRIFTWQIERDESYFRQFGAIQLQTKDGSLKLFPLYDESDYVANPIDSVRGNRNWIGSIYYNIVLREYKGKKYYTLLGFDDNDLVSTKKWIEVLTFDNNDQPVFGGKYFDYKEDSIKPAQPAYRFCLEYKKDARARMQYDPEMDMIVFDHLISESNEPNKKFTLIPDGDYEGFKWNNGKWVHVDNVFKRQKLKEGQAPLPEPFYDENGKPIKP
jgi:hypothetical protein